MKKFYNMKFDDISIHNTLTEHPENEDFQMHAHDRVEIYYFISGYCCYTVEGSEYVLKPGDVMVMQPSEAHFLRVMGDMPYERTVIHFFPELFKEYDPKGLLMKPFFDRPLGKLNRYSRDDFLSGLYQQCFESINPETPMGIKLETQGKLFCLLCELYKAYYMKKDRLEDAQNNDVETVVQLIDYINKNLYEPLSLSRLSDEFFLSQSQLNRLFKKAMGTSVWEYITIKRLIASRNRIRAGEHAGKVCISCGFKDYSSFYRMYKARFGVSPKQDDMTRRSKNNT